MLFWSWYKNVFDCKMHHQLVCKLKYHAQTLTHEFNEFICFKLAFDSWFSGLRWFLFWIRTVQIIFSPEIFVCDRLLMSKVMCWFRAGHSVSVLFNLHFNISRCTLCWTWKQFMHDSEPDFTLQALHHIHILQAVSFLVQSSEKKWIFSRASEH